MYLSSHSNLLKTLKQYDKTSETILQVLLKPVQNRSKTKLKPPWESQNKTKQRKPKPKVALANHNINLHHSELTDPD